MENISLIFNKAIISNIIVIHKNKVKDVAGLFLILLNIFFIIITT